MFAVVTGCGSHEGKRKYEYDKGEISQKAMRPPTNATNNLALWEQRRRHRSERILSDALQPYFDLRHDTAGFFGHLTALIVVRLQPSLVQLTFEKILPYHAISVRSGMKYRRRREEKREIRKARKD